MFSVTSFLAVLAYNPNPLDLYLPCSWDYSMNHGAQKIFFFFLVVLGFELTASDLLG
jgi:hypothetical protein